MTPTPRSKCVQPWNKSQRDKVYVTLTSAVAPLLAGVIPPPSVAVRYNRVTVVSNQQHPGCVRSPEIVCTLGSGPDRWTSTFNRYLVGRRAAKVMESEVRWITEGSPVNHHTTAFSDIYHNRANGRGMRFCSICWKKKNNFKTGWKRIVSQGTTRPCSDPVDCLLILRQSPM